MRESITRIASGMGKNDSRSEKTTATSPFGVVIGIVVLIAILAASCCVDYQGVHSITQAFHDFTLLAGTKIAQLFSLPVNRAAEYSESFSQSYGNLFRSLFTMFVGAALAAAGASYQNLFRNPVVSPSFLGVSSGASLGMAVSVLLFNAYLKDMRVYTVCFAFGLCTVLLVIAVAALTSNGMISTDHLLLVGAVLSSLVSGVFSALVQMVPSSLTTQISVYLLGEIYTAPKRSEFLGFLIVFSVGILPLLLLRYRINLLAFGEEEAQSLGVRTAPLMILVILCSTVLTTSTVMFCGIISWIGLLVPHAARLITGPNFKLLLPFSILAGAIILLIAEDVSILLGYLPLSIITSVLGAPVFFYLLAKNKREQF